LLSFLTALIISALIQFFLSIVFVMSSKGPRLHTEKSIGVDKHLGSILAFVVIVYLLAVAYSSISGNRPGSWLLLHSTLVAILVLIPIVKSGPTSHFLLGISVSMPVLTTFLSLMISGPMPIGQDDGRFTGYAYIIAREGRWEPFTYMENQYYQLFNVVPYLKAAIAIVTGSDMLYVVHPLSALAVTLSISLGLYVVLRNLLGGVGRKLAVLAPILFCATPAVSTLGPVPQVLSVSFYLTALVAVSSLRLARSGHASLTLIMLTSFVGTMTHALYPILLLATLVPLSYSLHRDVKQASEARRSRSVIRVVALMALVYWTYALILDLLVSTGKSWTQSLVDLITGQIESFTVGRPVWYYAAPPQLALAWTLLLALAAAYISVEILRDVKDALRSVSRDPSLSVGVTGALMLGVAFALRASPDGWAVRYFYPFYIFLIPAAIMSISRMTAKKRLTNVAFLVIIIATASYYAAQDPQLSPDAHNVLMVANRRSWSVAETLVRFGSTSVRYDLEQRVEIGFGALMMRSTPQIYRREYSNRTYKGVSLVFNLDDVGAAWTRFVFGDQMVHMITSDYYSTVYTDGLYKSYYDSYQTRDFGA